MSSTHEENSLLKTQHFNS